MNRIEEIFNKKCNTTSDINEHLPVLRKYSEECDTIVELGVRAVVSTWAFLSGRPKKLISVDIKHPNEYDSIDLPLVEEISKEMNIEFNFILSDSRTVDIPECDLLFIDTVHTYNQIKKELEVHSQKVKKYIILHDTETFRTIGEINTEVGIWPAVEEFLLINKEWEIAEELKNNNGLTIIKKK